MKRKLLYISILFLAILTLVSCNKRCRCIKYNQSADYFTPEELSSQGKTCSEMRFMSGLATQRYSVCEWVYNE